MSCKGNRNQVLVIKTFTRINQNRQNYLVAYLLYLKPLTHNNYLLLFNKIQGTTELIKDKVTKYNSKNNFFLHFSNKALNFLYFKGKF